MCYCCENPGVHCHELKSRIVTPEHEQTEAAERVALRRTNRQLLALNEKLLDEQQDIALIGDDGMVKAIGRARWYLLERIAMYMHHGDSRRGVLDMEQLRSLDRTLPPRPEA